MSSTILKILKAHIITITALKIYKLKMILELRK